MRRFLVLPLAFVFGLTACNSVRTPNAVNFAKAIDDYLSKHGAACAAIGQPFPINLPQSEQNDQYGIWVKLSALQQAGLVNATNMTAVVHGMLDPLRGTGPARPVKRYGLTAEGKTYFRQIAGPLGQTSAFCYGQKNVDSIVKWAEPTTVGTSSQMEVTYTYKIANAANWAERPDVQQAFPDIRSMLSGSSKTVEVIGLQLTNKGWEVPGQ